MSLGDQLRRAAGAGYAPGAFHIVTAALSATGAIALWLGWFVLTDTLAEVKALRGDVSAFTAHLAKLDAEATGRDKEIDNAQSRLGHHDEEFIELRRDVGHLDSRMAVVEEREKRSLGPTLGPTPTYLYNQR